MVFIERTLDVYVEKSRVDFEDYIVSTNSTINCRWLTITSRWTLQSPPNHGVKQRWATL